MHRGQIGIIAAVLAILLTVGAFLMVSSDGRQKAERATEKKVGEAFHTVHRVLTLGARSAQALAQRYARQTAPYFDAVARYENAVSIEMARAASTMEEGWSPDFVAVINKKRTVVWSQMNSTLSKNGTPVDHATDKAVDAKFITDVLSGRTMEGTGPVPFGEVLTSKPVAVAVPLLGAKNAVIGCLVLAWQGKQDVQEIRSHAVIFRNKLDVVPLLLPRQKADKNLEAMLSEEFPEEIQTKHGVKPAFMGLMDSQGVLLQRSDQLRLYLGKKLAPKSLALQTVRAQQHATTEAWVKSDIQNVAPKDRKGTVKPEILRVGFAPVTLKGELVGILMLAWELGDVHASRMHKMAGAHVGYLSGRYLSSTTYRKLSGKVLDKVPQTTRAPGEWKAPALKMIEVGGSEFYAATARLPHAGNSEYKFVVLASVDREAARYEYAQNVILVLGAILVIFFLLVNWLLRRYFIMSVSELERGVSDIVAGNLEHVFGVPSRETEGLAYSLNVLMAQLLGRPEPGDEDEEDGEAASGPGMVFSLGPLPDHPFRPGDSQLIPRLDEERDAHHQRIYQEYVEAMKELGEDTAGFDAAAFRRKLETNERMICSRLKCSEVRFSVSVTDDGVVLQPYPVA